MPNMVVAVLPSLEKSQDVLSVWEAFGVTGVTILESIGLRKLRQLRAQRDDIPLFPSLRHLLEEEEYHQRTIFVVVDDAFDLEGLIRVTEKAVGDLPCVLQGRGLRGWQGVCHGRRNPPRLSRLAARKIARWRPFITHRLEASFFRCPTPAARPAWQPRQPASPWLDLPR